MLTKVKEDHKGHIRVTDILDLVESKYPEGYHLVQKAYVYAAQVHDGSSRIPGEPYLAHPLSVAHILAQMGLDPVSVASGLLHHCFEDSLTTPEDLCKHFGEEVAQIVEGVASIGVVAYRGGHKRQAEMMRNMILAMSRDLRVVLVKLADRLHTARSLELYPEETQREIAREALDIYAPLAGRMGIDWIKSELEDITFALLEPETFREIVDGLKATEEVRVRYIEEVKGLIKEALLAHGIEAEVSGRVKRPLSIKNKMVVQRLNSLDQVYDIIAFRLIVGEKKDCYNALGVIHDLWKPIPGRFKDYIAIPKGNMYQSLHTSAAGPDGFRFEVQIRTAEMHRIAEEGIAAHWVYKEGGSLTPGRDRSLNWLRELVRWQDDLDDPEEFLQTVRRDLFPDEVYVFTPMGDVKALPKGSTPVDFAYAVHTEVGHTCTGAKVNGRMVPLKSELKSGDTVAVLTTKNHKPSKDWLKFVKTSKAQSCIRHYIKELERERSLSLGRELAEKEFRKQGLSLARLMNSPELKGVAKELSFMSVEDLLASVGYGKVSAVSVAQRVASWGKPKDEEDEPDEITPIEPSKRAEEGVRVKGAQDLLIGIAGCCRPLPGELVMGYLTRGQGIKVHRADCPNLAALESHRLVDVEWEEGDQSGHTAEIVVTLADVKGALASVSSSLASNDVNILEADVRGGRGDGVATCRFVIEVTDRDHLRRAVQGLRKVKHVFEVKRTGEL